MTSSAIPAAVASKNAAAMRAAIVGELVPVIPAAVNPPTYDPRELGTSGGAVWQAVIWHEKTWYRDPLDSTTAHDGISTIVLLDAGRYKTNAIDMPSAVLDRSLTTPPASPSYGDAYLVPAGATGAWATHPNEIAIWTARGWAFQFPSEGDLLYIADEDGYIHYDGASWVNGIGVYAFSPGIIQPTHLLIRAWNVENQTLNAPPATGPAGEQYIVGPSPTGTWASRSKDLAYRPAINQPFIILDPFVGEEAYDKATGQKYRWTGTVWASTAGSVVESGTLFGADVDPDTTLVQAPVGATTVYAGSPTVAPTTAQWHVVDTLATFTVISRRVGQRIEFVYQASVVKYDNGVASGGGGDSGGMWLALFRDSEVNALDWVQVQDGTTQPQYKVQVFFEVVTDDQASHVYKIRWMSYKLTGNTRNIHAAGGRLERRRFIYRMYS